MRKINCLNVRNTSRNSGRPKKTWIATIKNDLITIRIALNQTEWTCKIYVAIPSYLRLRLNDNDDGDGSVM